MILSTKDFDNCSWHDVAVHGWSIGPLKEEHGEAEIIFDIDYILKSHCTDDGPYEFEVAPADLRFHNVFNLKVHLDYASATAGMCPFSVREIKRESTPTDPNIYAWTIDINWPKGEISFLSPGFTQTLRAKGIISKNQWLSFGQRLKLTTS